MIEFAAAGTGMLFAGLWWVYPPAALIVTGLGALYLADALLGPPPPSKGK